MARRKRKTENKSPEVKTFSVEEVLDLADEANLKNIIIVGRTEDDKLALFGTVQSPAFYHHMFNSAVFQLNVMENNALNQLRESSKTVEKEVEVE
jgi:hypothetical protein